MKPAAFNFRLSSCMEAPAEFAAGKKADLPLDFIFFFSVNPRDAFTKCTTGLVSSSKLYWLLPYKH